MPISCWRDWQCPEGPADIAGIRAFAVHAKVHDALRFYEKFDFISSAADPLHLFVLLKDVRRIMQGR